MPMKIGSRGMVSSGAGGGCCVGGAAGSIVTAVGFTGSIAGGVDAAALLRGLVIRSSIFTRIF